MNNLKRAAAAGAISLSMLGLTAGVAAASTPAPAAETFSAAIPADACGAPYTPMCQLGDSLQAYGKAAAIDGANCAIGVAVGAGTDSIEKRIAKGGISGFAKRFAKKIVPGLSAIGCVENVLDGHGLGTSISNR